MPGRCLSEGFFQLFSGLHCLDESLDFRVAVKLDHFVPVIVNASLKLLNSNKLRVDVEVQVSGIFGVPSKRVVQSVFVKEILNLLEAFLQSLNVFFLNASFDDRPE